MRKLLLILATVVGLVVADQAVKEIAAAALNGQAAVSVIPDLFDLAYVENRGCAWGMFQGKVWPLSVFGLAALGVLIWKRKSVFSLEDGETVVPAGWRWCAIVTEPLLYAGIVGNLIDRIFRGYVIDMLDFHWKTSHFPCFNLADTFICVAAGLMVLVSLVSVKKK